MPRVEPVGPNQHDNSGPFFGGRAAGHSYSRST